MQRNAANARERARMRVLSSAFGRLKTKLPNIPPDTKLSKLDTLRLATMYIKQLKVLVEGGATNAEHHEVFQETAGIFNMQSVSQSMVSSIRNIKKLSKILNRISNKLIIYISR